MERYSHQNTTGQRPITMYGPDFPFEYDDWLEHPSGLGSIPSKSRGEEVAIVGAGMAGLVAAYELMKLGLKPVLYEASHIGGRLRSHRFAGTDGIVAELGGMRFPTSSTAFYHYVNKLGLETAPFPNPLGETTSSTVINLEGKTHYAEKSIDLPTRFHEIADAWANALACEGKFSEIQQAIRDRDAKRLKQVWNTLVSRWDGRTFYDFIATSESFARLGFTHQEAFGQVGFGMGGWDSDFSNSMLEILRVVVTNCDENQYLIRGGAEQVPRRLWRHTPNHCVHWKAGTSLRSLNDGAPLTGVKRIVRTADGLVALVDSFEVIRTYRVVLVTCQSWVLTAGIHCDESLFSHKMWNALNRTRYMQSSKTYVMVDRPFWKDKDLETGKDVMSVTLTDRLTRSTYLFDNGDDKPGVICLSYAWMSDAMKMLPHSVNRRVQLALDVLRDIYPKADVAKHIIGDPVTVSWEGDPHFLGAFKGSPAGHYRYGQRMHSHFMQKDFPALQRGIFIAGDYVSWTPGWAEGAVQTSLNAVWGIITHFGGQTPSNNPGPGDLFHTIRPIALPE